MIINILFTSAGRRNYLINYFKEALGGRGDIFAADMQLTAPALIDADVAVEVPPIYSDNYIDTLCDIISNNNIDIVIPLNDLELPILAANKERLERTGAIVAVSDPEVIKVAFDKWETVHFLEGIGLKSPKTFVELDKAKKAIKEGKLLFPVVLKPRWGSGSIGIEFPEDMEELELAYKLLTIKLKRTILGKASQEDIDRAILIQEKVVGKEYGLDILNDFDGEYQGVFAREKLSMRAGETDKAVSIINDTITEIGATVGKKLKHIGTLDCDVLERDGEFYVLELNPRFGGGYPFSHEAGMNTTKAYLHWLKGGAGIDKFDAYKAGIMFSKCDRLLRINND